MTDQPNDLAALWQSTTAGSSTDELIVHVEQEERSRRQLKWFFVFINVGVAIAAAYVELTGSLKVPGLLAALAISSAWVHWNHYHKQRKTLSEIISLSPREMLEHALKDAVQALSMARGMHTLFPGGAIFGYLVAPMIASDRPWYEPPEWVDTTVIVILVSTLLITVVSGHWIARKAKRRIRILEARLKDYDADV